MTNKYKFDSPINQCTINTPARFVRFKKLEINTAGNRDTLDGWRQVGRSSRIAYKTKRTPGVVEGYFDESDEVLNRVLDHELGHTFFFNLGEEASDEFNSLVTSIPNWNLKSNLSEYSGKNALEGQAESFCAYLNNKKLLPKEIIDWYDKKFIDLKIKL